MFGREEKVSPFRLTAVQYVLLGIFLLLAFGLWRLQVARSDYYSSLAEQNRIKQVPILAPRGKLLDREGRIIVDNYPSFSVLLLRDQNRNLDADADKIAEGLHIPPDELRARLKRMTAVPGYQPLFLKDDITPDELAFIESHRADLPELDIITVHRRLYPKNGFMAHVIGYVGQVSEDMLTQPQWELYNPGDVVGMSGVEQYYNDILMGKNGSRQVLVNSRGKEVGTLSDVPRFPGKQLKLTIDLDLQIAAEQALEGKPGAIVAMDPRTGEILAMVSRPAFDPNAFAVRVTRDEWNQLITDPGKPLLNKAIQAQLAPGSVFKIIMATAGMQEGIAQDLVVNCGGGKSFYGRFFKCWIASSHGTSRQREHQQGDLPVVRLVLLHAGGEAGHQPHRQVRDHAGTGTEDRRRSAAGSLRRDAVGRVEDQELQAEVVRRRDHFRRHRAGRGGDDADSAGARDWRDYHRRVAAASAHRVSRAVSAGIQAGREVQRRNQDSDRREELDDHHRRDGAGGFADGNGGQRAICRASTSPARPAARRPSRTI